jgi:hypothetical protein
MADLGIIRDASKEKFPCLSIGAKASPYQSWVYRNKPKLKAWLGEGTEALSSGAGRVKEWVDEGNRGAAERRAARQELDNMGGPSGDSTMPTRSSFFPASRWSTAQLKHEPQGKTLTMAEVVASNAQLSSGLRAVTAADVAKLAYGDATKASVIEKNNTMAFLPDGTPIAKTFFCPALVEPINKGAVPPGTQRGFVTRPDWVATERAAGESYPDEIVVLLFQRNSSSHTKIRGTVSMHYRASLFEASRAVEITWPFELNADPLINLYGNHVVCAFRGKVFFMGVLVSPSVNTEGGITMTWVAQSHTYVPLTSHFNPAAVNTGWKEMAAIDVLSEISTWEQIPMRVDPSNLRTADEKEKFFGPKMLGYVNTDEDGLKSHDMQDVLGTTPIKFIQDILEPTGIFATADDDGFLLIHKVHIDNPAVRDFIEGEPGFEIDVQYDFKDLAKTYCVLSQRRDSEAAEAVRHDSFPLPIYRNAVRSNTLLETGELSRRELSKALAKAVDIKITVPGWVNERTGQLWRLEDTVFVFSPRYGLLERLEKRTWSDSTLSTNVSGGYYETPLALIISGIKATWSDKGQTTELMLSLPGVFDTEFYRTIPFLTAPNEAFIVENVELKVPIIEEEAPPAGYEDD